MSQEMKKVKLQGAGLHHFIATGGLPKDYKGTKGVNPQTVNNVPKSSK